MEKISTFFLNSENETNKKITYQTMLYEVLQIHTKEKYIFYFGSCIILLFIFFTLPFIKNKELPISLFNQSQNITRKTINSILLIRGMLFLFIILIIYTFFYRTLTKI